MSFSLFLFRAGSFEGSLFVCVFDCAYVYVAVIVRLFVCVCLYVLVNACVTQLFLFTTKEREGDVSARMCACVCICLSLSACVCLSVCASVLNLPVSEVTCVRVYLRVPALICVLLLCTCKPPLYTSLCVCILITVARPPGMQHALSEIP